MILIKAVNQSNCQSQHFLIRNVLSPNLIMFQCLSSSTLNWNMSVCIWFLMVSGYTGLIPKIFAGLCVFCCSFTGAGWQAGGMCLAEQCCNTGLPHGLDLLLTVWSLQRHTQRSTLQEAAKGCCRPPGFIIIIIIIIIIINNNVNNNRKGINNNTNNTYS